MSISISGSSYGHQGYSSINVNSKKYEGKYRSAMYAAVKAANPNWQPGQPFGSSILDSVTREIGGEQSGTKRQSVCQKIY